MGCSVFLVLFLVVSCLGQNFGNSPGTGFASTTSSSTTTSTSSTTTTTTTTTASPSTTSSTSTTSSPTTSPGQQVEGKSTFKAAVGAPTCQPPESEQGCKKNILFSYTDLFKGSNSQYCCPHRTDVVYIAGSGSVNTSPQNPDQTYQIPRTVVGTATLSDSPYTIGAELKVNGGFLRRGDIVTLWFMAFKNGTCTGPVDSAGLPTCQPQDALLPGNVQSVFASGMVSPSGSATLSLSGFYMLPSSTVPLNSTVGYELQFIVSDNGPAATGSSEVQVNTAVWTQWWTINTQTRPLMMARFPPRPPTVQNQVI